MSTSLIELLLVLLLAAVALNFLLTARIAAIVREAPEPHELPFTFPVDTPAPALQGRWLDSGQPFSSERLAGIPMVLVFLSSGCADCRKRVPELTELLPVARRAGVELLVVTAESKARARAFLGTALFEQTISIDAPTRKSLNPRNSSPFYLFIGGDNRVEASNFVGDADWLSFVEQLDEHRATPAEANAHAH